jgi:hypothetical protein
MNIDEFIDRLFSNAETIQCLVAGITDEQARWRPAPDKWSILEVVNHLYDEEREDFRERLGRILNGTAASAPGIDPQGWVTARGYNERDPGESLDRFLRERLESIEWLKSLDDPDWDAAYNHPSAGRLTAGDMLASWLAHDLLHIRQIAKLHYQYLSVVCAGRSIAYAGELT